MADDLPENGLQARTVIANRPLLAKLDNTGAQDKSKLKMTHSPKVWLILGIALTGAAPAYAATADQRETVFSCQLHGGKTVTVTVRGEQLTYRYGMPRRAELRITAGPSDGKALFLQQRYAGPQRQLRFTNGEYSYIVHYMGAPPELANSFSGLVVMRGGQRIFDRRCTQYREFEAGWDVLHRLPEDREEWSVM